MASTICGQLPFHATVTGELPVLSSSCAIMNGVVSLDVAIPFVLETVLFGLSKRYKYKKEIVHIGKKIDTSSSIYID